jgi:hypothetical protein
MKNLITIVLLLAVMPLGLEEFIFKMGLAHKWKQ